MTRIGVIIHPIMERFTHDQITFLEGLDIVSVPDCAAVVTRLHSACEGVCNIFIKRVNMGKVLAWVRDNIEALGLHTVTSCHPHRWGKNGSGDTVVRVYIGAA